MMLWEWQDKKNKNFFGNLKPFLKKMERICVKVSVLTL